ncbi:hypothetical protein A2954_00620 [Candidatus Roizmanbacteria bacterium RIFCSPLOWO2_01_FULL_37_12]|uniref:Four helix bundle protein n=1 Tax=Candidatus Roizmanbacteria bacterium RIFCSPLOWO2_01_FULL_37_12 TaxID=1802056 RepID=A0A1F7I9W3_9BACT|nr:MAG: hypothetical protein A3D76_00975 [Candidatus Roizmanbacteria bacterium RIFCSPHIGHO2_02_FULL_37_9b]OGK40129.1 MAG: hypothetical protein A2954_00620 [Candidatus Roizmanbacteria bacterium RIFCSPLOWO2_01_FULL_37_12]
MIKDVTDIEVYKESLILLKELYEFLKLLPLSEYDTKNQCKRAGKSIPALIAEGYAKKNSEKEFKRFLLIALGSSDEIVSHLRVISIVLPKLSDRAKVLEDKYKTLSKRINKLHSIWQSY